MYPNKQEGRNKQPWKEICKFDKKWFTVSTKKQNEYFHTALTNAKIAWDRLK